MPRPRVAGLVLAAGLSTRLGGGSKLLLPYARGTLIEAVVRAAEWAGLDPTYVVVGHAAGGVRAAISGTGARVVINPEYRSGQGSSLAAGARELASEPSVAAVAVLLADEPGIDPRAIERVVAAWASVGPTACRARYSDRPGHPVLFGRECLPELASLRGDEGGYDLLGRLGEAVLDVPLEMPAPVDVDTRADHTAALARLRE